MPGFPVVLVYVCLPSAATRVPAPFSTIIARVFRTKAAAMRPRAAAEAAGPTPEAAEIFGAAGAAVQAGSSVSSRRRASPICGVSIVCSG